MGKAPETMARITGPAVWGPQVFSALSQRLQRTAGDAPWIAAGDAEQSLPSAAGSIGR